MDPYYNGFKGKIHKKDKFNYITKGKYQVVTEDNKITITELPIGKWTDDYKKFLDSLIPDTGKSKKSLENEKGKKKKQPKKTIIDYVNNSSDKEIEEKKNETSNNEKSVKTKLETKHN